jgi:ABC-type amino acid transport system permease subunit
MGYLGEFFATICDQNRRMAMDAASAYVAGMAITAPISLAGMMSAFMWATWIERGDRHGVVVYRNCAIAAATAIVGMPILVLAIQ